VHCISLCPDKRQYIIYRQQKADFVVIMLRTSPNHQTTFAVINRLTEWRPEHANASRAHTLTPQPRVTIRHVGVPSLPREKLTTLPGAGEHPRPSPGPATRPYRIEDARSTVPPGGADRLGRPGGMWRPMPLAPPLRSEGRST